MPPVLAVFGDGAHAIDVVLRRVLTFRECKGPVVILDGTGRGAQTLGPSNRGGLQRRSITWVDVADRRRPLSFFQLGRSSRLRPALIRLLRVASELQGARLSEESLAWAADVAHAATADGTIGLGALLRILGTRETRRWFVDARGDALELGLIIELLRWMLRFPSVVAASEGPNHEPLVKSAGRPGITWIEARFEHMERLEHLVAWAMVEAATDAALAVLAKAAKPEFDAPTVVHVLPSGFAPATSAWLRDTRETIRHVAVLHVDRAKSAGPVGDAWTNAADDIWLLGRERRDRLRLPASFPPDGRRAVGRLPLGDAWIWNRKTGKSVVASVRGTVPEPALGSTLAYRSGRTRRVTPIVQLSTYDETCLPRGGAAQDLYARLCEADVLRTGWLRTRGAARWSHGVDGVSIQDFGNRLDEELGTLAEELKARTYRCRPLRRVMIPKPDGGTRDLGVACVRDRVVQSACLDLLEPVVEPTFSRFSYAFRPHRSAHHAIEYVRSVLRSGRAWVVEADIRRCFDEIDHERLFERLEQYVADEDLLALIRHWLTVDVLAFGDLVATEAGVPQGESLSPLLANIYLDPLDRHIERLATPFARYADDLVLLEATESRALNALVAIEDFLRATLHLALKESKTRVIHANAGVDFLGFRLRERSIGLQPGRADRFLARVDEKLKLFGDMSIPAHKRFDALETLNALIRGFRTYFLLPDEPALAVEMADLDERVEELAYRRLSTEMVGDGAWVGRARLAPAGATHEERASRRAALGLQSIGGYPEDAATLPPPPSTPRGNGDASADVAGAASAVADTQKPRQEEDDDLPTGIVRHGARLHVLVHGSYLKTDADELVVRRRRDEVYRCPLDDLDLVYLQGRGMTVSADLPLALARRGIPIVLASTQGNTLAALTPIATGKAKLRAQQALRRDDPEIVRIGLAMLAAKVDNQASLLKYFAKYRARVDEELARELNDAAGRLRGSADALGGQNPASANARTVGMGIEGHAAALYWHAVRALISPELGFRGRVTRDATDPVNQCLNYVYGALYAEVWRAVAASGLDPYFGLIHGSQRDQGSLVFDLIEELRAPFGDRVVLGLLGRGFRPETATDGALRTRSRRILARAFLKAWCSPTRCRTGRRAPADLIQRQASSLARVFDRDGSYRPFRMRW